MGLRYISVILLFVSSLSNAWGISDPSDEILKIAKQQVKDLDEMLILIDPNATLSDTQKRLITDLFVEKIEKTREIKSANQSNERELIENLMKDIMQQLHYDILSKNQREAKFEYQKNYQSR